MPRTVGDLKAFFASSGFTPDQTAAAFRQATGLDLAGLPDQQTVAVINRRAKQAKADAVASQGDALVQGWGGAIDKAEQVLQPVRAATGVVDQAAAAVLPGYPPNARLAAQAKGMLDRSVTPDYVPDLGRAAANVALTINKPLQMGIGAIQSVGKSAGFQGAPGIPTVGEAFQRGGQGFDDMLAKAGKQSAAENFMRSKDDRVAGVVSLLDEFTNVTPTGLENKPFFERLSGESDLARQTGANMAGGMVGGMAAQGSALLQHPVDTLRADPFTVFDVAPMLKGAKANVAGAASRLADRLPTSKVARVVADTLDDRKPGTITSVEERFERDLSDPRLKARQQQMQENGASPEDIAEDIEANFPERLVSRVQAVKDPGKVAAALKAGGRVARDAALGYLFLGDVTSPLMGTVVGMLGEPARQLIAKLPADRRAGMARWFRDPTEQARPEETARAQNIVQPPERKRANVETTAQEIGGRYKADPTIEFEPLPSQTADPSAYTAATTPRPGNYVRDLVPDANGNLGMGPEYVADVFDRGQQADVAAARLQGARRDQKLAQSKPTTFDEAMARAEELTGDPTSPDFVDQPFFNDPPPAEFGPDTAPVLAAKDELYQIAGAENRKGRGVVDVSTMERRSHAADLEPNDRVPFKTTSPEVESAIDRIHQAATEHLADPGAGLPRKYVGRQFTDGLVREGMTKLREPRFRGLVETELQKRTKLPAASVRAALDDIMVKITKDVLGPDPQTVTVAGESMAQVVGDVFDKLDPKTRGEILQGTVERVGRHVGLQVQEASLAQNLQTEWSRFGVPLHDTGEAAHAPVVNAITKTAKGETRPLVLPYNPTEYAAQLARDLPTTGTNAKHATAMVKYLQDFVPLSDGGRHLLAEAVRRKDIGPLPTNLYVHKGFASTLENTLQGMQIARETIDGFDQTAEAMGRQAKLAQTAYNIPTGLNNILSNLVVQSIRMGKTPMGVGVEWTKIARDWKRYLEGKEPDGAPLRMRRGFAKRGLADTTALEAEIGHLTQSAPAGVNPVRRGVQRIAQDMRHAYKMGDVIPKLHEAEGRYVAAMKDLERLGADRYYDLPLSEGRTIRLIKRADGTFVTKGKRPMLLDSQELADIVADSASKSALDLFVDFQNQSKVVSKLKNAKGLGALAGAQSPFVSWQYSVTDLPGKKGMASHIYDYVGPGLGRTDDAGILARRMLDTVGLTARRMALTNATRGLLDPERQETGKLVPFNVRRGGAVNIAEAIRADGDSPDVRYVNDFNNSDPFSPTMLAWRAGWSGLLHMLPDSEIRKIAAEAKQSPEGRKLLGLWAKNAGGEWFEPLDALQLAGVTGGLWKPFAEELSASDREKRPVEWNKLAMLGTRMAFGGTPASLLDVGVGTDVARRVGDAVGLQPGVLGPTSPYTTRQIEGAGYDAAAPDPDNPDASNALTQPEDFWRGFFRKMLGVGYRKAKLANRTSWYIKEFQTRNDAKLDAGASDQIKQLMSLGRTDDAKLLMKHLQSAKKVLREVVKQELLNDTLGARRRQGNEGKPVSAIAPKQAQP
jgi:hypothetical protein